ncbi:MAG: hypothetical protein WBM44_31200 [Waterburya sp.]
MTSTIPSTPNWELAVISLSGERNNPRSLSGLWKADVNYAKCKLGRSDWEKAHQQQIYRN